MEEKNCIKISLSTVLLIISLIIIIIMGYFIYKLYQDKQTANNEIVRLGNTTNNLNYSNWSKPSEILTTTEEQSIDINNYIFELDSKNKYTIITDLRWKTMLNDGGSHSSIYYQVDLDNSIISKVQEDYHANLGGSPKTEKNVIYIKKIDTNIREEVKSLLNEITTKEDINETHNYNFFTISSFNTEKFIYNIDSIKNINNILKRFDELKN